jgi:hypothetical protein
VFEGLEEAMSRFPFPILGMDSDNGAEFINHHLQIYCKEKEITFTRSREYRKNDNCFVEQKNWHIVRKTVGYWRYETEKEVEIMNKLYKVLRLYTNFFQPQMKLIKKAHDGSKVIKKYDKAQTPYQRTINCPDVKGDVKRQLKLQYQSLNPVDLRKEIVRLQNILYQTVKKNPYYQQIKRLKKEKEFVFV